MREPYGHYFGYSRSDNDEDAILLALGYVWERGKWRNPTPKEARASGHWRLGKDEIAPPVVVVPLEQQPGDPF